MNESQLVKKFEPLICKLTSQFHHQTVGNWDDIKSMAYLGFVLAIRKYDENRSNMSFKSFAAFMMKNTIMTCLTNESRVVKLPFEEQKSLKESGQSTFNRASIDYQISEDNEQKPKDNQMGLAIATPAKFDDGDVLEYLYTRLEQQFNTMDCEIFYMTFGLKNHEELQNKEIAKKLNLSEGRISQRKKEIIKFIRQDNDLCEMLASLMN